MLMWFATMFRVIAVCPHWQAVNHSLYSHHSTVERANNG